MPLPLSGTAEVEAGEDIVAWIGAALTPLNCVPGATIALDGRTYFVKERLGTDQLQLTRAVAEADGTVPAEIEQLSPEQVATATLNRRAAQVMSELSTLDANGRGLFYNLIGVTGDNDPGPGNLALNQTDLEDVTEIYLDVLDANDGGRDVSGIIDLWPMNTVLIVRSLSSNAYGAWRLLGTAVEAGYRRLQLGFVGRDGDFGAEPVAIEWRLSGADKDVDAEVDTPDDLVDHDDAEPPFRVLVQDYDGEGRAARVSKLSGDAGAWSGPAWWTGSKGDKGDTGPRGVTPRGAYSGATAYVEGDVVRDNGSSWVALGTTIGNAPPVYPTSSNDDWELLAVKGQDGTGTGDVVGPASSVNNRIVVFSGPTGKSIADSGVPLTFASQAEAEAGSENTKFVTSLRVRQSIHASAGRYDANQSLTRAQKGVHAANVGIGWEKIDAVINLAGLASAQWTNLGDFCRLRMSMAGRPVNTGIPVIRVSQDNGASWDLGATDYQNTFLHTLNGAAPAATLVPQTYIYAAIQSWHQAYGGEVIFEISRFNKSSLSFYSSRIAEISGTNSNNQGGVAGYHNKIVANNAIIAFAPSGGWANGDIMLEGIRG